MFLLAIPVKAAGFVLLFSAARLRARTTWQATLDLATFSEFGLIVVAAAVESALLPDSILTSVAVAVALSLVVAAPIADAGRCPLRAVPGAVASAAAHGTPRG